MFFDFIRERKRQTALGAVLTIVLGLILLFSPSGMIATVLGLVGWLLAFTGMLTVLGVLLSGIGDLGGLILGALQVLCGGWMIRHPYQLTALAAYVVGALVLIHAVHDLRYAVAARRVDAANWWTAALSGGLTLLLAVLVLVNPLGSVMSLVSFGGICLIVDGVSDLFLVARLGSVL